ncbi:MAG: hypothetical protein QGG40_17750, partial [Myxococcota bacterium]|nr:hypothetical protein [Myxococcota bacterium]
MRLVALVAAVSVGLFACDGGTGNRWRLEEKLVQRFPRLPKMFSAVVSLRTGGYASLLVEFQKPGSLEQVRIFPGILASGPGWVSSMSVELSVGEGGAIEWLVHRTDLLTKERQTSSFDTPVRFRSLDREHLALQTESSTESLVLVPRGEDARQWDGSDLQHMYQREGPGEGFEARLNEDRLELRLPRGDTR